MIFCAFLTFSAAMLLREFTEELTVYVLPFTPITIVELFFLSASAIICFLGFESIARFAKLMAYFLLAGYVAVIILNFNNYDIKYLFPIGGMGTSIGLYHGFVRSSFYSEFIILGIIAHSLQGTKNIKKIGITALIISSLITSCSLLTSIMAFNYATAQEMSSLLYSLTRLIHIGTFLQRLDPLFIFPWNIGSMISITTVLYCSINIYCKVFRMSDFRPAVFPFCFIIFSISMLPKDFIEVANIIHILRENGYIVAYGIPILVLIISLLRRKKGVKKHA